MSVTLSPFSFLISHFFSSLQNHKTDHTVTSLPKHNHSTHWKHTRTVVRVTADDLSSQTLTVAPLPLRNGAVALSPPGSNPAAARLGTVCPAAPLTPTAITWKKPQSINEPGSSSRNVFPSQNVHTGSGQRQRARHITRVNLTADDVTKETDGHTVRRCTLGPLCEGPDRAGRCPTAGGWSRSGSETGGPPRTTLSTDPRGSTPTTGRRLFACGEREER